MARACRIAGVVVLAWCSACNPLRADQPIGLVLTSDFSAGEERQFALAADCWNRAAGTQLSIAESGDLDQEIEVFWSDWVCVDSTGRTEPLSSVKIGLCSPELFIDFDDPYLSSVRERVVSYSLFRVFAHELGHALHVRGHASQGNALMSQNFEPWGFSSHFLSDADRQMVDEGNPELEWPAGNAVVDIRSSYDVQGCRSDRRRIDDGVEFSVPRLRSFGVAEEWLVTLTWDDELSVYRRDGDGWSLAHTQNEADPFTVAVDGDTLLIERVDSLDVVAIESNGALTAVQTIGRQMRSFGAELDGDRLVVDVGSGAAIFERQDGLFQEVLSVADVESFASEGERVAFSSPADGDFGGRVVVMERGAGGEWVAVFELVGTESEPIGGDVVLSGEQVIVRLGRDFGVFNLNDAADPAQVLSLGEGGFGVGDIVAFGDLIAIGRAVRDAGVYLYQRSASGEWTWIDQVALSYVDGSFGRHIEIDSGRMAVKGSEAIHEYPLP